MLPALHQAVKSFIRYQARIMFHCQQGFRESNQILLRLAEFLFALFDNGVGVRFGSVRGERLRQFGMSAVVFVHFLAKFGDRESLQAFPIAVNRFNYRCNRLEVVEANAGILFAQRQANFFNVTCFYFCT